MESLRLHQSAQTISNHPDDKSLASHQVLKSGPCHLPIAEYLGPKDETKITRLGKAVYPRAREVLRKMDISLFKGIKVRGCDVLIHKFEHPHGADAKWQFFNQKVVLRGEGQVTLPVGCLSQRDDARSFLVNSDITLVGIFNGDEFKGCINFVNGDVYEGEMTFNIQKAEFHRKDRLGFKEFTLAYAKGKTGMFHDRESGKTVPCSVSKDGIYENGIFFHVPCRSSREKDFALAKSIPSIDSALRLGLAEEYPDAYYEKVTMVDGVPVVDEKSDKVEIKFQPWVFRMLRDVQGYACCYNKFRFLGRLMDDNGVRRLIGSFTSEDLNNKAIVIEGTCQFNGSELIFENARIIRCKCLGEWMENAVRDNKITDQKRITDPKVIDALNKGDKVGAQRSE